MEEGKLRRLWDIYHSYGPSARVVLNTFGTKRSDDELRILLQIYEQKLENRMIDVLKSHPNAWMSSIFGQDDSHSVLIVKPKYCPTIDLEYISPIYEMMPASPRIGVKLGVMSSKAAEYKGREPYKWLLEHSTTAAAAGWFFDGRCQGVFSREGKFTCALMTDGDSITDLYRTFRASHKSTTFPAVQQSRELAFAMARTRKLKLCFRQCPGGETDDFPTLPELSRKLRTAPGSPQFKRGLAGVHLRPKAPNLSSIDSLVITVDKYDQPRAIFFQFTIAERHPMGCGGLAAVWNCLPNEVKRVPPAIVLVLPDDRAPAYKVQTITDVDCTKRNDECPSIWPQYKLAMTEAVLWSKPHSSQVLDPLLVFPDPIVPMLKLSSASPGGS